MLRNRFYKRVRRRIIFGVQILKSKRLVKIFLVIVAVLVAYQFASELEPQMRIALAILVMASGFWMTEAIPLAATSLLIGFLQPLFGIQAFDSALKYFFDPVVVLLLGGFLLAIAMEKYDLDEYFADKIVSRFGVNLRMLVLGLMLSTAFLSMWISNTASTALMITLALKFTADVKDEKDNLSKIMILGISYSATVGGLGSLLGTPPNALAAGLLKDQINYDLTFLGWMLYGIPLILVLVFVIWLLLFRIFPTPVQQISRPKTKEKSLSKKQKATLTVFLLAVIFWFSGSLPEPLAVLTGWHGHGLSTAMVAALVGIMLFLTGLLDEQDLTKVNWNTLLLFGGGLSLGSALEVSGLTMRIGQSLVNVIGTGSTIIAVMLLGFSAIAFSAVASNTASASVFVPIAISVGISSGINPVVLAVLVAICSSLDFALPIGTPPNAIAYSTGKVKMREMIRAGIMLDLLGGIIAVLFAVFLWGFFV